MISPISKNDSSGHNTIETTGDKHKLTTLAHVPIPHPQTINNEEDIVTLSHCTRARLLKNQGNSTQEIATVMNLDVITVTGYLG